MPPTARQRNGPKGEEALSHACMILCVAGRFPTRMFHDGLHIINVKIHEKKKRVKMADHKFLWSRSLGVSSPQPLKVLHWPGRADAEYHGGKIPLPSFKY